MEIAKKELISFMLYNTLTKQKEVFKPRIPGKVSMYVCGVTAYDYSHIGHARAYVAFDVLYRYMKYLGFDITYVRNFTDIDDKIINRAIELKEDPLKLSNRFCNEFQLDMVKLQCLPPNKEPRVSDHIDQIKNMILQIIKNNYAYVVDGDVYFSLDQYLDYGKLSGRHSEDNRAGERVAIDSRKKNPSDFALWKSAKPGEPSWDSPWGPGRPGWHIECSAMSTHYLGPAFDIHGGGEDLVFPHHENELAQSCAACSESQVTYWVHNGFVKANNEKMSKSLGNFITIRDAFDRYHPLALRLFLMRTHYRSPVNYTDGQLEDASDTLFYIYKSLHDCEVALAPHCNGNLKGKTLPDAHKCLEKLRSDFQTSMADDLHTNIVLAAIVKPLKIINNLLKSVKGKKQQQGPILLSLISLMEEVKGVLSTLGLLFPFIFEVLQELKDKALKRANLTEMDILEKIEERDVARRNKEYKKSDRIREMLDELGIALMDEPQGTTWEPRVPAKYRQKEHEAPPQQ